MRVTMVMWTNMSSPPHDTVSGDPGDPNPGELWDSGLLFKGDSFSRTFEAGETSDFFCSVHPTRMFGRVFVDGTGVQGTMIPANTMVTAQKITFDIWLLNFTGASQSVNGRVKVRDPGGSHAHRAGQERHPGADGAAARPIHDHASGWSPSGRLHRQAGVARLGRGYWSPPTRTPTTSKLLGERGPASASDAITAEGFLPGWEPRQPRRLALAPQRVGQGGHEQREHQDLGVAEVVLEEAGGHERGEDAPGRRRAPAAPEGPRRASR